MGNFNPNSGKNKHRDTYRRYYENDDKSRRYVHSKSTFEENGIKAGISEDGKVTIIEDHPKDDTYDEITVPASFIFKIAMMLEMTRSIKYVNREEEKDRVD